MLVGKKLSKSEFYDFISRPENADKDFELINGEVVPVMPVFGYTGQLEALLTTLFGIYLLRNPIAHFTSSQTAYELDDENTVMPDVGIILKSHLPTLPTDSYIPMRPDIAVEVVSKSDLEKPKERIEKKQRVYQVAGVPLTLYVYPERREIEVYRPGQEKQVMRGEAELDLGAVLPGFVLRVSDVFPAE